MLASPVFIADRKALVFFIIIWLALPFRVTGWLTFSIGLEAQLFVGILNALTQSRALATHLVRILLRELLGSEH